MTHNQLATPEITFHRPVNRSMVCWGPLCVVRTTEHPPNTPIHLVDETSFCCFFCVGRRNLMAKLQYLSGEISLSSHLAHHPCAGIFGEFAFCSAAFALSFFFSAAPSAPCLFALAPPPRPALSSSCPALSWLRPSKRRLHGDLLAATFFGTVCERA